MTTSVEPNLLILAGEAGQIVWQRDRGNKTNARKKIRSLYKGAEPVFRGETREFGIKRWTACKKERALVENGAAKLKKFARLTQKWHEHKGIQRYGVSHKETIADAEKREKKQRGRLEKMGR